MGKMGEGNVPGSRPQYIERDTYIPFIVRASYDMSEYPLVSISLRWLGTKSNYVSPDAIWQGFRQSC